MDNESEQMLLGVDKRGCAGIDMPERHTAKPVQRVAGGIALLILV